MKAFETTEIVKDGRIVILLPDAADGERVRVVIEPTFISEETDMENRLKIFKSLAGSVNGPFMTPEMTRRENMYNDDGACY
jgi:hypothetical protein